MVLIVIKVGIVVRGGVYCILLLRVLFRFKVYIGIFVLFAIVGMEGWMDGGIGSWRKRG